MDGEVRFTVNGVAVAWAGPPLTRLLDVLREHFHLTGTKEGCGEGECGACTVLLDGDPVCACLVPVFQAGGSTVTTIEGLARGGIPDPLQEAFVREGGVQCGACTPGILLTARALLDRNPAAGREEVREALGGNLCRCTGYERIIRSVLAAAGGAVTAPGGVAP